MATMTELPPEPSTAAPARGPALFRAARRLPFLGAEEERELALRARAGDAAAAERLVIGHLQVVIRTARRYGHFGVPLNDLIQEGLIGLIHAVRKFNPEHDNRLATYALWWVRAAMQEHVVRSWSLVRVGKSAAHRALFFALGNHIAPQQAPAGRHPGDNPADERLKALARRFGLPPAEVATMAGRLARRDLAFDTPARAARHRELGLTLAEQLPADQPTPEEVAVHHGMARLWSGLIDGALAMLPAREATIIRERWLTDAARTFEAIGQDLGLSKDRVRQLEKRAIERLRQLLGPQLALHGLPG